MVPIKKKISISKIRNLPTILRLTHCKFSKDSSSFYCLIFVFRKVRMLCPAHFIIMIKNEIPFLKKRYTLEECEHFLLQHWFNFNVYKDSYNKLYDSLSRQSFINSNMLMTALRKYKYKGDKGKITTDLQSQHSITGWQSARKQQCHESNFTGQIVYTDQTSLSNSRNSECHKMHYPSNFLQHTHKQK